MYDRLPLLSCPILFYFSLSYFLQTKLLSNTFSYFTVFYILIQLWLRGQFKSYRFVFPPALQPAQHSLSSFVKLQRAHNAIYDIKEGHKSE